MSKLTQNQRTLLDAVATAPLQTVSIDDIDGKPGALTASARALARRGLITLLDGAGEGDAGPILSLTEDGRALCAQNTSEADNTPAEPVQKPRGTTKQQRPGTAPLPTKIAEEASALPSQSMDKASGRSTKKAAVLDLLSRKAGASIAELQIATGWQAHSIRAVLTGLRKDGHTLTRERADGAPSIYRIVEAHG